MTIPELSLAMAVSGVILVALMSFTVYASRCFVAMGNYVDLEQRSQNALDTLTRDIREMQYLTNYRTATISGVQVTNELTFVDVEGTNVTFLHSNDALLKIRGAETTTLLTDVDFLSFQIFQRNTMGGTFNQFPTADAQKCKLVAVSWICSRRILGSRMNTESVQTAKIVIRKQ
jgi:hypothetical protein